MISFDKLQDNPDLLNTLISDMESRNVPTKKAVANHTELEFLGYDPEGLAIFRGDFGL